MDFQKLKIVAITLFLLANALFAETKRIAIVRDDQSAYFDAIISGFKKELDELAQDRYEFEFVDTFNAEGISNEIRGTLMRAVDDPKIDLVYTAGIIASHHAENLPLALRTKPIVAGAIEFSNFDNSTISKSGSSKIPNFTFIVEARRIPMDLSELARISGQKTIHVPIDPLVIEVLADELTPKVDAMEKLLGLDLVITPAGENAQSCLAKISASAKAVYLPILPALPIGERKKLITGLNKRKVMTLSMFGEFDVQSGALASLSSDASRSLFRRTAINIHQLLSGIPTSLLPVVLRGNDQLRINMNTARLLGWSPDYDTLLAAELIHLEDYQKFSGDLTLEQAMARAAKNNANTRVARARLSASYWETQSLRSNTRPQLSLSGSLGKQGISDRITSFNQANTDSLTLGAEVSQILYSDRLTSQIRANESVEEATKFDIESVQLDAMQQAGLAYLDCLLAEELYQIERANLSLAAQNLNLAKIRRDIGAAEPSEVFRWQASLAEAKAQLIQRDAARKNTRFALNVALGQRAGNHWKLKDIFLSDNELYFMDKELAPLLTNLQNFEGYVGFIKAMSLWRAPELKAFDKNLAVQGILFNERGRRNYRPEIKLTAAARRLLTETSQNYDSQGEWSIGVGFNLPLWEGDLQTAEQGRISAVIRQLKAQRDKATYLVEQKALTNAYNSSASHPGVRLSRQAQTAAEKNYQSVGEKYAQSSADILDLIDAQVQLVTQRRSAASAKFTYLKDVVSIQRSMAWFEFNRSDEEKAIWTRMLRNYLQTGSLHITHLKSDKQ